jgi:hypothetical protein
MEKYRVEKGTETTLENELFLVGNGICATVGGSLNLFTAPDYEKQNPQLYKVAVKAAEMISKGQTGEVVI